MVRLLRGLVPLGAAAALVAAAVAPPALAASPAAYSVTISAHTKYPRVTGDSLVIYKSGSYSVAYIRGQVAGAKAGDVATLFAERHGSTQFKAVGRAALQRLQGVFSYSFKEQPPVATKYRVRVTTGTVIDAASATQAVYVTAFATTSGKHQKCGLTRCTFSYHAFVRVPPSAYNTETRKHIYLYLAVGYPRLPKDFSLSRSARSSKIKGISRGEFEFTVTFVIPLRRGSANWDTNFCSKDDVSRDGLGLPGRHGCGNRRIGIKAADTYLG